MKKILSFFKNKKSTRDSWFLVFIVSLYALRIPSLIEPYWYGDEGIYEVIGMGMRQGRLLYQGVWDNKPPVLYLIYAFFNGDQFSVRFTSLIFGAVSSVVFFVIARKIFKSRRASYISTLIFTILFATPVFEGNIANSENFMILLTLLGLFFVTKYLENKNNFKYLIYSGLILSLSFLTKVVAIFDFLAFFVSIFALSTTNNFTKRRLKLYLSMPRKIFIDLKPQFIFGMSFILLPLLSIAFFALRGALGDYFRAAFSQNVGYVGYGNYFIFPMGLLVLKSMLLIISILFIIKYANRIGETGVIVYLWTVFSLYSTLFSARPYTHYVLVFVPAFSFFVGLIYDNKNLVKFNIAIFLLMSLIIWKNFHYYSKILPYYSNYLDFVFKNKSATSYLNFFDPNTSRDYEIVKFIDMHTNKKDNIFLWSDSAQIYALTNKLPPGRYIVSYHITFYKNAIEETQKAISEKKPKYIIVTKKTSQLSNFISNYNLRYRIGDTDIYERQYN